MDTFASIKKLLPKFKVLLVDEVHDCMSDVPVAAYRKMTGAGVRIGFSATPFKWHKKQVDNVHKWTVKSYFGHVFKTTTTASGLLTTNDLQNRGILSKSDCVFYPINRPDLAYEPYQDAVKLGIEQNLYFHDIVKRLARSLPGRTLIVVERIAQGEYLSQLIPEASWIQGENSLKEREPVINALRKDENCIAIVMKPIITAGIDIKIHNLINAAGGEGAHNVIQQMGRGLRTADDKTLLKYFDFLYLMNDYLRNHSEWRMQVLQKEGFKISIYRSEDERMETFKKGRIDLDIVTDGSQRTYEKRWNIKYKRLSFMYATDYWMAFHISTPDVVIDALNRSLQDMKKDGSTQKIADKYLPAR
jgi:superfamily II DNA or RNA helicase